MRIRQLLADAGSGGGLERESVSVEAHGPEVAADWGSLKSPETYVGHQRAEKFASPGGAVREHAPRLCRSAAPAPQSMGAFR